LFVFRSRRNEPKAFSGFKMEKYVIVSDVVGRVNHKEAAS
jgi:hypothetical protein